MASEDDEDQYPSAAEQAAFSEAHDLTKRLVEGLGLPADEVGKGIFVAALSVLRKSMTEVEIAKILYEAADDYATRHLQG